MKKNGKSKIMNTKAKHPNKHLIEGAALLIKTIKTPAPLLDLLTESLWWMDELRKEKKENPDNFIVRQFIENIVQPWFAGGENVKEKIATGLEKLRDSIGAEGYSEFVCLLVQAFGLNMKQSGIYIHINKFLQPISALLKLSPIIEVYEEELFEKRNISKAA